MKLRICIVCLLLFAFLMPSESRAFDKQRKGFILGLGAGYGSATIKYADASESYGGVATTLKLGAGLSENVLFYYSNGWSSSRSTGLTAVSIREPALRPYLTS